MVKTLISLLVATSLAASQATACSVPAILVFDGSGSMSEVTFETQGNTRIKDARRAIHQAMPQITPYRDVGLLIYGPGGDDSCSGIDLRFHPAPDTGAQIIAEIDDLDPGGLTPLVASVGLAAEVLSYKQQPAVVVLVTDGNETCGGGPCALAQTLSEEAQALTIHVIGFRAVVDFFSWNNPEQDPTTKATVARCLADLTGGLFITTDTV